MSRQPSDPQAAHTLALAGELRVVISKLKRRLREQAHLGDFTWSQASVVLRLESDGPATVTALARSEGVRPQSMGATISTLEEAGLVSGAPDPNDGRQTVLSLTKACKDLLKASRTAREDWLFHAIENEFNAKEQKELATGIELLKRLAES
jgi:DNA-binding MarR family transcriptional regulator